MRFNNIKHKPYKMHNMRGIISNTGYMKPFSLFKHSGGWIDIVAVLEDPSLIFYFHFKLRKILEVFRLTNLGGM